VSVEVGPENAVCVVIPAYNAQAYIRRALESVLSGHSVPAEIIVVDDCSSDGTADIARAYGVRTIRQPRNAGPAEARNAGVAATRCPWVAFLDADDVWHPEKLAIQWAAIRHWPNAGLCFTDYDVIEADGTVRRHCEMLADSGYKGMHALARKGQAVIFESRVLVRGLIQTMFIRQSSAVVKRSIFLEAGGYDGRYRIAEDYDFFLRVAALAPAISVEGALVDYVRHDDALSADPLREIASIDALWDHILAGSGRYQGDIVAAIGDRRLGTVLDGARLALRLGRNREARPFIAKALRLERSFTTYSLYALWRCVDNPVGRLLQHLLRSAWRLRHNPHSAYRRAT
jgi:glycosyltransferase involved in cell wall biosynthesis